MSGPDAHPGCELQHEIEQLLYCEADLLDERRFREWLNLLADDLRYWMPIRTNRPRNESDVEFSGNGELSFFEETKKSLARRVERLESGMAWAEDPPSRTRHLISNVRVRATDEENEYEVSSAFLLYRTRLETDENLFAGRREDRLRRIAPNQWRIARRRILLDQGVILAKNLSVLF